MQRGGAVQIFLQKKTYLNKLQVTYRYIPKGRRHFCTERRVPPCAAGRGCAVFYKRKNRNVNASHTYNKREAAFLYGEEVATLCSGEGLCRYSSNSDNVVYNTL